MVKKRPRMLVFQDSVGITSGYKGLWEALLKRCGLTDDVCIVSLRSTYSFFPKGKLLQWDKGRKQPKHTTNPMWMKDIREFVATCVSQHNPDLIVCMDPALLFMLNPVRDQCTLDRLRGGLYIVGDLPWVVTLPLTALHTKMKTSDIAKLNEGYTDKADWEDFRSAEDGEEEDEEDDDSSMEWHEPIVVPYGRAVLDFDFQKVSRLLRKISEHVDH